MFRVDSGKILPLCEVIPILLASSFVIQAASEASRTTLVSHDLPQIIRKNLPHRMAHVQIWGKGQLKSFLNQLFEHILETELSGKLIIAPNLNMSHRMKQFTPEVARLPRK